MEEWTQKQGIGEAKNSSEDPQIPEYEICLLAPVGTKSSLLSSSRKGVSRNSVRNSSLDSSKHIFLSNRQPVGTGRQHVTHCQSSTQTHPGEE